MINRVKLPVALGLWLVFGAWPVRAVDESVNQILTPICQEFDVPAMAAAVVTSEGVRLVGVAGVRKRGVPDPVTVDDRWHLGSDTKAMTTALVGRLVERGQLEWDRPLGKIFPELAAGMHPAYRAVTLVELLSHQAGLPANLDLDKYSGDDVVALRRQAAVEYLAKAPGHPPGKGFEYSNLDYILIGAVIEQVTGKLWEQAIKDEIFTPLQMSSAGFGGTGTPGRIDQPWPHTADGKPAAGNGPAMDNPPVMGPAGRVHCTIQDWARFVQDQLRGAEGKPALLKPETYRRMQTPPFAGDYALGWLAVDRGWAGGLALNHAGDNTMNFANVWIAPEKDFAVLVCVNQGGEKGFKASDKAVGKLIGLLSKTPALK